MLGYCGAACWNSLVPQHHLMMPMMPASTMLLAGALLTVLVRVVSTGRHYSISHHNGTSGPFFAEPIQNVTVPIYRRATLSCIVDKLEGHRVAWLKGDTHTILTIHTHVITHNSRISMSHNGQRQWNLHIDSVKEVDRGFYMCQINTAPMTHQSGYLEVVIPPDISWDETSSDVSVNEGECVSLTCKAVGYPRPIITWRREDSELIVLRVGPKEKVRVQSVEAETLNISRVHRRHMGVYLCIASNGIPPSVSRRVRLQVNFQPIIKVPNQLVGAPLGTEVELECFVEVSPRSANYWTRDTGAVLINGSKYTVNETPTTHYKLFMRLVIRDLEYRDFGTYNCVSKNSLGEAQGSVRLRVLDLPSTSIKVEVDEGTKIDTKRDRHYHFTPVYQNESVYHQKSTPESTDAAAVFGMNQSLQGKNFGSPFRNASGDLFKELHTEKESQVDSGLRSSTSSPSSKDFSGIVRFSFLFCAVMSSWWH